MSSSSGLNASGCAMSPSTTPRAKVTGVSAPQTVGAIAGTRRSVHEPRPARATDAAGGSVRNP